MLYTVESALQDPITGLWAYRLKDNDGDIYDGPKSKDKYVAQSELRYAG